MPSRSCMLSFRFQCKTKTLVNIDTAYWKHFFDTINSIFSHFHDPCSYWSVMGNVQGLVWRSMCVLKQFTEWLLVYSSNGWSHAMICSARRFSNSSWTNSPLGILSASSQVNGGLLTTYSCPCCLSLKCFHNIWWCFLKFQNIFPSCGCVEFCVPSCNIKFLHSWRLRMCLQYFI